MYDQLSRSSLPSVLNTTPRRVRYVGRTGWKVWVARLFILPHTLVGLALIGAVILGPFWAIYGVDRTATVVDAAVRRSSDSKKRNTYELTYVHAPFGIERRETESVPLAEFSRVVGTTDGTLPPEGPERPAYQTVRVRGWGRAPFYYEQIVGQGESPWEYYFGPAIMCVFWNALLVAFVRPIFYIPWRLRRIYRHGDVDPGIVTNKWAGSGKSPSYWIAYDFRVGGGGETVSGKTQVRDQAAYDALLIGQPVAVLHPPGRPKPNAVYEVGPYTCD